MTSKRKQPKSWIKRNWIGVVICLYQSILLLFLFAELDISLFSEFRATNQVLLLLALLFLPFVLIASSSVVKSIRVKLQGHDVEVQFGQIQRLKNIHEDLGGRQGEAELVITSMLAGKDINAAKRLKEGKLIIGAKEFRASRFLAHVLGHHARKSLEDINSFKADWPNGSTLKNFADIKNARIDLYIEYTGTGCQLLGIEPSSTAKETLKSLNDATNETHGIEWLNPIGAIDNYRLVVLKEVAEEKGWKTIRQMAPRSETLTFAAPSGFFYRKDGYEGLCELYDLKFKIREMTAPSDTYDRLRSGEVDVIIGWDSDPQLLETEVFVALEDDAGYFPDYHAVPLVRIEALEAIPDLKKTLNGLAGKISTAVLQEQSNLIRQRGDHRDVYDSIAKNFVKKLNAE